MGKKRTLAIILLLCVLGGLIACGRKEKEDEYTYTIKLNDNASGSKQFSSCGYLWVYSVTDQMFTKYGNGEMPSSWTVGDTYIFFTTEQKNGGMDSSYKLWRCNKATNECEFLGDMSSDARLNIHENYLFLAFGKDKVWLMPVEGDLGERINLAEQLAENDGDSGRYELDIAGYHGWNIYSYDGDIIAVTDQDDHSVAISNVLSIDVRVDKHWYYKDGESIEFRDDYFQYRRAGEDEWHDICPEYFGNILWFKLGIREVNFLPKRIVKEGEKLYLSVEIGRTKVLEMSQKHLEREVLVEIDLETDTSRMLYDTRNNRTRIVGYREGNVYLLKDHIVYKNVLKTGEQREMYDYVMEKKETLAYCMYYFVVFDHGLSRMAKLLDCLLNNGEVDNGDMILIKSCVAALVTQSIEMGTESKAGWEDAVETCNPEIWKEVMFALRKVKGRRGNRKVVQSLDDILTGDKVHIKQGIRLFLEENTEDISLAYLLKALVKAGMVKASIRYMTFHRAIEQFSQRHYGHDIPQKRYGEIKDMTLNSPQRGSSYTKAKRIIDRWSEYFINNG